MDELMRNLFSVPCEIGFNIIFFLSISPMPSPYLPMLVCLYELVYLFLILYTRLDKWLSGELNG